MNKLYPPLGRGPAGTNPRSGARPDPNGPIGAAAGRASGVEARHVELILSGDELLFKKFQCFSVFICGQDAVLMCFAKSGIPHGNCQG